VPAPTSNYLISPFAVPDRFIVVQNYHDHRVRPMDWIEINGIIGDQRELLETALRELGEVVQSEWENADPEKYFGP
jgi:hypothetical protein